MGWASGSELLSEVWGTVRPHIPVRKRVKVLAKIMSSFADHDCDTMDELFDEYAEAKKAYLKVFPDEQSDDDEPEESEEDIL